MPVAFLKCLEKALELHSKAMTIRFGATLPFAQML
mgnify:CR=1 FL=1